MEMAQYILSILRSQLMIVFSWGFNTPIAIEDGLQFNVEGFKHQGKVRVHYNGGSDLFDVTTLNRDGSIAGKTDEVYLDELVNVIDSMVERTPNYKERVEQEYRLSR